MVVHGLGLSTDLALIATRGQVADRGDYLVASTPDDPTYYYGNLIVLPAAPRPDELPAAIARFAREFGHDPAIRHVTLCWDGIAGDVGAADELIAADFTVERTQVMIARAIEAVAPPAGIALRPLTGDELARAVEIDPTGAGDAEARRRFLHRRAAWQRDLVTRGLARFWGAFDDHALVGSLGVARLGPLGRYQDVQTAATHRRRGIASALLAAAGRDALAAGVEQLVLLTVAGSDAARLYARAGFALAEHTASACRPPR